jgi:hypothetical protein
LIRTRTRFSRISGKEDSWDKLFILFARDENKALAGFFSQLELFKNRDKSGQLSKDLENSEEFKAEIARKRAEWRESRKKIACDRNIPKLSNNNAIASRMCLNSAYLESIQILKYANSSQNRSISFLFLQSRTK